MSSQYNQLKERIDHQLAEIAKDQKEAAERANQQQTENKNNHTDSLIKKIITFITKKQKT